MADETPVAPPPRLKLTSLEALSKLMLTPMMLIVPLEKETVEIAIKGLTGEEAAVVDKIPAPTAPLKMKPDPRQIGKFVTDDSYDYKDPAYVAARREYVEKMRASIIEFGLVDIKIPGETLDAKCEWLRKNLPPRAVDLLETNIRKLTGDEIKQASFSSASE